MRLGKFSFTFKNLWNDKAHGWSYWHAARILLFSFLLLQWFLLKKVAEINWIIPMTSFFEGFDWNVRAYFCKVCKMITPLYKLLLWLPIAELAFSWIFNRHFLRDYTCNSFSKGLILQLTERWHLWFSNPEFFSHKTPV